jgi:predicted dehydrogenase
MNPGIVRVGMVCAAREAAQLHRAAAVLDGEARIVAGVGVPGVERVYASWREFLDGEAAQPPEQRVDVVALVGAVDSSAARGAVSAGMHVLADPAAIPGGDAGEELLRGVKNAGTVFACALPCTAYPMVRRAMELVREGKFGVIRRVVVECGGPGAAGALRDLGPHAEGLASAVSGLKLRAVCADWTMNPARRVEDDASVLLRFDSAARGVILLSQNSEAGIRLRVQGVDGSFWWESVDAERLWMRERDGSLRVLTRAGVNMGTMGADATRFPPGVSEGGAEALANLYRGVFEAIRAKREGRARKGLGREFPTLQDGLRALQFVEAAAISARSGSVWVDV